MNGVGVGGGTYNHQSITQVTKGLLFKTNIFFFFLFLPSVGIRHGFGFHLSIITWFKVSPFQRILLSCPCRMNPCLLLAPARTLLANSTKLIIIFLFLLGVKVPLGSFQFYVTDY